MFWRGIVSVVVVGALIIAGLTFVDWQKLPFGKTPSLDFFWLLGLITVLALAAVFWYFIRQKDTDSIERARTFSTFAIVIVGILILWGVFFSAMSYIREPLNPNRWTLTATERAGLTEVERTERIQELRTLAQAERSDRIIEVATLAGLIIAPLSTLIGFVAGQAAGSAGQEMASERAGQVVGAAARQAREAQRQALELAGQMTPDQFATARSQILPPTDP